jgi:2-oxo-4-hydroxy-4-carboxy-5-ureidoimidazoline decarboxylase
VTSDKKDPSLAMTITQLNELSIEQANSFFVDCCHCISWAENMSKGRPFMTVDEVLKAGETLWNTASEDMLLEAFNGHALIGDRAAIKEKYSAAAKEQGQIEEASDDTITALAEENQTYYETYGFIFIVCASGKSAEEMLFLLRQRMGNSREQELQTGGSEQGKITQLRLQQRLVDA